MNTNEFYHYINEFIHYTNEFYRYINEFYHYINEFYHYINEFYHYIIKYHWISMNFIIISMNLFIMPMNFIIISMNLIIISMNLIIISMNLIIISINLNTHTQAFQRLRAAHSLSSQQHIWLTSTVYRSSIDFLLTKLHICSTCVIWIKCFFLIRCLFENIYVCFLVRTRIFMCFVVSWMFCYAFWGSLKVELCVLPLVEWWVMCFTLVQSCGRLESNVVTWSLMVETNVELWVWWCWNADLWVCCMKLMKLHGLKK